MAGISLPAPPTLPLDRVKDPAVKEALLALQVYIDSLRRQIERDYT